VSLLRVVRSFTIGGESSPKSGKPRSVPMVREVATTLARLSQSKADAAQRLAMAFEDEDAAEAPLEPMAT
jgi:hypothetical protein